MAKEVLAVTAEQSESAGLELEDVQEALLILLVQELKERKGAGNTKSILQYEVDSLGSGGVHEVQRR